MAVSESILERIPYGLFAIASMDGGTPAAMVATWVSQVSFSPPLLAAAIERDSRMRRCLEAAGVFSVNLIPRDGIAVARDVLRLSSRPADSLDALLRISARGIPVLRDALASVLCRVVLDVETGDHILFVGEALEGEGREGGEPLLLHDTGWRYRRPKGEHPWQP
jgi:flavin reductase (DIM6/NTAB) family NADH-FMN oxidoreductase RutF